MLHAIDTRPRDSTPGRTYVLVADANAPRTAACLESLEPFGLEVHVARHGNEADSLLQQFGPPVLLITDLALPPRDGFALIEAVRDIDRGRAEFIAWSSSRALREFAAHRLAGLNVRVFGTRIAPDVLRRAVGRALRGVATGELPSGPPDPPADDVQEVMTAVSEEARRLCGTPGVAVYVKTPGETPCRAFVTWTSEAPFPQSQHWMPDLLNVILETGDALVLPAVTKGSPGEPAASMSQDGVGGLVAVPLLGAEQQVVGTICVFDLTPLTFGDAGVEALRALGRRPRPRLSATPDPGPLAPHPGVTGSRASDGGAAPVAGPPTVLLDRQDGDRALARELARRHRDRQQLSVVLFDVDPLTGAPRGARHRPNPDSLAGAYDAATKTVRGSDLAIQWDREQLLLVLPGLNHTDARRVGERVRAAMQAGARHGVLVAGGVAELLAGDTTESVVARASARVQLAQARGHNRLA